MAILLRRGLIQRMVTHLSNDNLGTSYLIRVLRALNECINNPKVIEHLIGTEDDKDSLFRKHMLRLLFRSISAPASKLVETIVRKIGIYEACAIIGQWNIEKGEFLLLYIRQHHVI